MRKAATVLLLVVFALFIVLNSVFGSISVLYRPILPVKKFADPTSATLDDIALLSSFGVNKVATSTANSLNFTSFPVTIQYANGKIDFIAWHFLDTGYVPANTVFYVYVNVSQMSIAEGSKTVIYTLYVLYRYSSTQRYAYGVGIVANETHIWFVKLNGRKVTTEKIQDTMSALENKNAINITAFDSSRPLIITAKCKSTTYNFAIYIDTIYILQNGEIITQYNYRQQPDTTSDYRPTLLVSTKYQLTVVDMFVSYNAPDVLLSQSNVYTVTVVVKDPDTGNQVVADYVRVYNASSDELMAEVQNTASATFSLPYGDYRFEAVKGQNKGVTEKTISGNETVTIWLSPPTGGGSWLYVVAQDPDGNSVTAQATLRNSSWSDVKATPANFTVSPGEYTLKVEAEGYETFTTSITVNGPTFYTAPMIPQNNGGEPGNSTGLLDQLQDLLNSLGEWWGNVTKGIGDFLSDPIGAVENWIGQQIQEWLDSIGLGWITRYWWAVLLAIVVILIVIAKED